MDKAPIAYDQWGKCGKYFEWRDHHVFFQRGGKGEVLLMLHGFPTAGWDWCWVSRLLIPHFHILVPDLLDYGRSLNSTKKPCSIMDQADMLEALVRHRGIESVHILAHDVGDTVAQELIARHNESSLGFRIKSAIFLNGGMIPTLHRPRLVQRLLASPIGSLFARVTSKRGMLKALAAIFGKHSNATPEALDDFWPAIVGVNGRAALARRIRYMAERREHADRWVGALKAAKMPMMLINGVDDPVSGGHAADGFAREVPKAKIARLPGIGHFPQVEAPEAVGELVLKLHQCIREKTLAKEGATVPA